MQEFKFLSECKTPECEELRESLLWKNGEGAGQDAGQEEVTEGRESDSEAEVLCVGRKRAVAGGVGMMAQRR